MTEDEYMDAADLQKLKNALYILQDINNDNACYDVCRSLAIQIKNLEERIFVE